MDSIQLAITMGDPAGVGPETIAKAWAHPLLHRNQRLTVVGHPEVMRRALRLVGGPTSLAEVRHPQEAESSRELMPVVFSGADEAKDTPPAQMDPRGGQAAYDALMLATDLALVGDVDGIVTSPLHKTSLAAAGYTQPGHTELLAEKCGSQNVAMMLYLPPGDAVRGTAGLGVVHATLHTALRDVFDQLTDARIVASIRLADDIARFFVGDTRAARLAVCALNPHGGENGRFGNEERQIIEPAVRRMCAEQRHVVGPLPADTLMVRAAAGEFDAVVAMYHDQGHIALKLLGMHRAVNITLGLPIVRTSVAHGTAFDLAWRGLAEESGLIEAIRVAAKLVGRRDSAPLIAAEG